jgi:hypothetical protein
MKNPVPIQSFNRYKKMKGGGEVIAMGWKQSQLNILKTWWEFDNIQITFQDKDDNAKKDLIILYVFTI